MRLDPKGKFVHTIDIGGRKYEVESTKSTLEEMDLRAIARQLPSRPQLYSTPDPLTEALRKAGFDPDGPTLKPHPKKQGRYVGNLSVNGQQYEVEVPKPQLSPEDWRRIRAKLGDPAAIRWENEAKQISPERRGKIASAPLPQLAASSFLSAAAGRIPQQMRTPETMAAIAQTAKALKQDLSKLVEKRTKFGAGAKFPWEDVGTGNEGEFASKLKRNMVAAASEIQAIDALAKAGIVTPELAYRRMENERRLKTYEAQLQAALNMRGEEMQKRIDRQWTYKDVLEAVGDLADDVPGTLAALAWSTGVLPAMAKGGVSDFFSPSFWARARAEAKNYRGAQREVEGILSEWDAANPALATARQLTQAAGKLAGIGATSLAGGIAAGRAAGWLASKTGSKAASAVAKTFGLAPAKTLLGKIGQAGLYQLTVGYPNLAFSAWKTHDETYQILKEQGVPDKEASQIAIAEGLKELQPWLPVFDPNTHIGHKIEAAGITALMLAGLASGTRRAVEANPAFQRAYVNAKMPFLRGEKLSRLHTETLYTLLQNDVALRHLWGMAPNQDARAEVARIVGEDLNRFKSVVDAMGERLKDPDGMEGLFDYLGAVRVRRQVPRVAPKETVPSARPARAVDEQAEAQTGVQEATGEIAASVEEAASPAIPVPYDPQEAFAAQYGGEPEFAGPELDANAEVHYWRGVYRVLTPEQLAKIDSIQAKYEAELASADAKTRKKLLAQRRRELDAAYSLASPLPLKHTMLETISSLTPDLILRMEGPEHFSMITPRGEATALRLTDAIPLSELLQEGEDPLGRAEYEHLTEEQRRGIQYARGYHKLTGSEGIQLSPEGPVRPLTDVIGLAAGERGRAFAERATRRMAVGDATIEDVLGEAEAMRRRRAGASDFLHELVHHLEKIGAIPEDSGMRIAKWLKARRENPDLDGREIAKLARTIPDESVTQDELASGYEVLANQIGVGLNRPGAEAGSGVVGTAVRYIKGLARHALERLGLEQHSDALLGTDFRKQVESGIAERNYFEQAAGPVAEGIQSGELLATPAPRTVQEAKEEAEQETLLSAEESQAGGRPFDAFRRMFRQIRLRPRAKRERTVSEIDPVRRGDKLKEVATMLWARNDPQHATVVRELLEEDYEEEAGQKLPTPLDFYVDPGPDATAIDVDRALRKAVLDTSLAPFEMFDVVPADGSLRLRKHGFPLALDVIARNANMPTSDQPGIPYGPELLLENLAGMFGEDGERLKRLGMAVNAMQVMRYNLDGYSLLTHRVRAIPEFYKLWEREQASSSESGFMFPVMWTTPEEITDTEVKALYRLGPLMLQQIAEGVSLDRLRLVPVVFPNAMFQKALDENIPFEVGRDPELGIEQGMRNPVPMFRRWADELERIAPSIAQRVPESMLLGVERDMLQYALEAAANQLIRRPAEKLNAFIIENGSVYTRPFYTNVPKELVFVPTDPLSASSLRLSAEDTGDRRRGSAFPVDGLRGSVRLSAETPEDKIPDYYLRQRQHVADYPEELRRSERLSLVAKQLWAYGDPNHERDIDAMLSEARLDPEREKRFRLKDYYIDPGPMASANTVDRALRKAALDGWNNVFTLFSSSGVDGVLRLRPYPLVEALKPLAESWSHRDWIVRSDHAYGDEMLFRQLVDAFGDHAEKLLTVAYAQNAARLLLNQHAFNRTDADWIGLIPEFRALWNRELELAVDPNAAFEVFWTTPEQIADTEVRALYRLGDAVANAIASSHAFSDIRLVPVCIPNVLLEEAAKRGLEPVMVRRRSWFSSGQNDVIGKFTWADVDAVAITEKLDELFPDPLFGEKFRADLRRSLLVETDLVLEKQIAELKELGYDKWKPDDARYIEDWPREFAFIPTSAKDPTAQRIVARALNERLAGKASIVVPSTLRPKEYELTEEGLKRLAEEDYNELRSYTRAAKDLQPVLDRLVYEPTEDGYIVSYGENDLLQVAYPREKKGLAEILIEEASPEELTGKPFVPRLITLIAAIAADRTRNPRFIVSSDAPEIAQSVVGSLVGTGNVELVEETDDGAVLQLKKTVSLSGGDRGLRLSAEALQSADRKPELSAARGQLQRQPVEGSEQHERILPAKRLDLANVNYATIAGRANRRADGIPDYYYEYPSVGFSYYHTQDGVAIWGRRGATRYSLGKVTVDQDAHGLLPTFALAMSDPENVADPKHLAMAALTGLGSAMNEVGRNEFRLLLDGSPMANEIADHMAAFSGVQLLSNDGREALFRVDPIYVLESRRSNVSPEPLNISPEEAQWNDAETRRIWSSPEGRLEVLQKDVPALRHMVLAEGGTGIWLKPEYNFVGALSQRLDISAEDLEKTFRAFPELSALYDAFRKYHSAILIGLDRSAWQFVDVRPYARLDKRLSDYSKDFPYVVFHGTKRSKDFTAFDSSQLVDAGFHAGSLVQALSIGFNIPTDHQYIAPLVVHGRLFDAGVDRGTTKIWAQEFFKDKVSFDDDPLYNLKPGQVIHKVLAKELQKEGYAGIIYPNKGAESVERILQLFTPKSGVWPSSDPVIPARIAGTAYGDIARRFAEWGRHAMAYHYDKAAAKAFEETLKDAVDEAVMMVDSTDPLAKAGMLIGYSVAVFDPSSYKSLLTATEFNPAESDLRLSAEKPDDEAADAIERWFRDSAASSRPLPSADPDESVLIRRDQAHDTIDKLTLEDLRSGVEVAGRDDRVYRLSLNDDVGRLTVSGTFEFGSGEELATLADAIKRVTGKDTVELVLAEGTKPGWGLLAGGFAPGKKGVYRLLETARHTVEVPEAYVRDAEKLLREYAGVEPDVVAEIIRGLGEGAEDGPKARVTIPDAPRADGKLADIEAAETVTPVYTTGSLRLSAEEPPRERRRRGRQEPRDFQTIPRDDALWKELVQWMTEKLDRPIEFSDIKTIEELKLEDLYKEAERLFNVTNIDADGFGILIKDAWAQLRSEYADEYGDEQADLMVLEHSYRLMASQFAETDLSRMVFLPGTERQWGQDVNPATPVKDIKRQWVDQMVREFRKQFFRGNRLDMDAVERAIRQYRSFVDNFKAYVDSDGVTHGAMEMGTLSVKDEATLQALSAILQMRVDKLRRQIFFLDELNDPSVAERTSNLEKDLADVTEALDVATEALEINGRIAGTVLASRRVRSLTDLSIFVDIRTYRRMVNKAYAKRKRNMPQDLQNAFDALELFEKSMNLTLRCAAIREELEQQVLRKLQMRDEEPDEPRREQEQGGRRRSPEGDRQGGQQAGDQTGQQAGAAGAQQPSGQQGGQTGQGGGQPAGQTGTGPQTGQGEGQQAGTQAAGQAGQQGGRGRRARGAQQPQPEGQPAGQAEGQQAGRAAGQPEGGQPAPDQAAAAGEGRAQTEGGQQAGQGQGAQARQRRERQRTSPDERPTPEREWPGEGMGPLFDDYRATIDKLERAARLLFRVLERHLRRGTVLNNMSVAKYRQRLDRIHFALFRVRRALFSGAEFGRLLAWSEEYSELLKLAEEKGGRYIKKAERMFEKLAEEMERELYIGKDVVPDIEEDLQEPQAYLLPGMISQKKNLPGNVPFKPGDAGVADPVVSETRDALSNSEILRDTVTASILANRLFVARDKVIRIRKGDRRYYEEWLRRQSQRADDAELLRRMNDPSLTSIERLRLAVIRESELANIARELDILNRRLKATAKAEATDQSTPMVGSRPVDTGNLNREKKVRLHETRQMVDGWTSVARAMAFLREATDALRENRIQPTPENVETLIRDENFIKRLEKQGLNLEEFKRRLRSGAVLSAVARAVRDQARFTEEIKAGRRMPGTVTALPENPESEEYRALDTYLREAGVEGGIQQATEIMESARQLRTQARLWREIRELMEIVGEQAGDFDADRAKAVLERGASPFEPNLETQRVMEIKRELRDQLEWMVSHLEGQNIFEEIRGTLRALVYTALPNRLVDFVSTGARAITYTYFGLLDYPLDRLVWRLHRGPRDQLLLENATLVRPPADFLRALQVTRTSLKAIASKWGSVVKPFFKEMGARIIKGQRKNMIEFRAAREFLQQPSEKFGTSSWTTWHAHVDEKRHGTIRNLLLRLDSVNAMLGGFTQIPDITWGEFVHAHVMDTLARSMARGLIRSQEFREAHPDWSLNDVIDVLKTGKRNGQDVPDMMPRHLYLMQQAALLRTDISFMAPNLEYEKLALMGHLKTKRRGRVAPESPNLKEEVMSAVKLLFDWLITPFPRMMWRLAGWATDYHIALGPLKLAALLVHRKLQHGTKGVPLSPYERLVIARKIRRFAIGRAFDLLAMALAASMVDEDGEEKEPPKGVARYFVGRWDPNGERFVFEPLPILKNIPLIGSAATIGAIGGPFQFYEWAYSAARFREALKRQKDGVVVLGGKTYKAEHIVPILGRIYSKAFVQSLLMHPMIQKTVNFLGAYVGRGDIWTEFGKALGMWYPGYLRHLAIYEDVEQGIYTRRPQNFKEGFLSKIYPWHRNVPFNGVGRIFGAGHKAQLEFLSLAYDPQEEGSRIVGEKEKELLKTVGKPIIDELVTLPLWQNVPPYKFVPGTLEEDDSTVTRRVIAKETVAGIRSLVKFGMQFGVPAEDLIQLGRARLFFVPVAPERMELAQPGADEDIRHAARLMAWILRIKPEVRSKLNPFLAPALAAAVQQYVLETKSVSVEDLAATAVRDGVRTFAEFVGGAAMSDSPDFLANVDWDALTTQGQLNPQYLEDLRKASDEIMRRWREVRRQLTLPASEEEE